MFSNTALITAALANVKVEEIILNEEEAKSKETKAKTLTGKFPFLETDQGTLFESAAIARYLASQGNGALLGSNDFERALVNQWVDYVSGTIYPNVFPVLKGTFGWPGADSDQYNDGLKSIKDSVKLINTHLQGKEWLVGSSITVADVATFLAL